MAGQHQQNLVYVFHRCGEESNIFTNDRVTVVEIHSLFSGGHCLIEIKLVNDEELQKICSLNRAFITGCLVFEEDAETVHGGEGRLTVHFSLCASLGNKTRTLS